MARRSTTPTKTLEDRDRTIIKLKSQIRQYREHEAAIPLLLHNKRELLERIRILTSDLHLQSGQEKAIQENTVRNLSQIKAEAEILKLQLKKLETLKIQLNAQKTKLNARLDKENSELEKLQSQNQNEFTRNSSQNIQTNKLYRSHQTLLDDLPRLQQTYKSLNHRYLQTTRALTQLKSYVEKLQAVNKQMFNELVNYEEINNRMEDQKNQRLAAEQNQNFDTKKKDEHLKQQLQSLFQLQSKRQQLKSQIDLKSAMLKNQQHKKAELQAHIKIAEKCIMDLQQLKLKEAHATNKLTVQNEKIQQTNTQYNKDMELCQSHLQNLLVINEQMNAQLNRFFDEGQFIKKVITARRKLDQQTNMSQTSLKRSKVHF